jgi:methylmalonyl-CoA mutase N-terminal domain/subunit
VVVRVAAIEQGFQKAEIERSAYQVARQIDAGERVVVGVNRFILDRREPYEPLRIDPGIAAKQAARLRRLRAGRDQAAVDAALKELRSVGRGTGNVLYPLKEALRRNATVGEVCDALRDVWGHLSAVRLLAATLRARVTMFLVSGWLARHRDAHSMRVAISDG